MQRYIKYSNPQNHTQNYQQKLGLKKYLKKIKKFTLVNLYNYFHNAHRSELILLMLRCAFLIHYEIYVFFHDFYRLFFLFSLLNFKVYSEFKIIWYP